MFKNYIKIAFRNLRRERAISFINILGLAIGFASCIFIFLFVRHELTFDDFHEKGNQIYRLVHDEREFIVPGGRLLATTGPPVGPALTKNFPEVLNAVRVRFTDRHIIAYNEKRFYEENIVYIDSTLFEVFSFPLQTGNTKTALNAPNKVVITSEMAEKYFGDEDPLGKTLQLDDCMDLSVTGVFKRIPQNSHLEFGFAISFATFAVPRGYPITLDSWGWISFHNYLLLHEGIDPTALEAKFPEFISTHWDPERAKRFKWRLQPLKDIYFGEVLNTDIPSGNIAYIYGLSGIGILILLMGSFNFMNLSIARSITRSKEVGIRKVLGAFRTGLIKQFLGESVIISLLGFILAFALFEVLGQVLAQSLQISLPVQSGDYQELVLLFLGISIAVGIVSGGYPALVVSHFQPSKVLKGKSQSVSSGILLRKILVVVQFSITIGLIAGSIVISDQMNLIRTKDLGLNKEEVLILPVPRDRSDVQYARIRHQLRQNPHVADISAGSGVFDGDNGSVPMFPEGAAEEGIPVNIYGVHFDFFKTLGIEIARGRPFSEEIPGDTVTAIILNNAAASVLGWYNPVGKPLRISNLVDGYVIGLTDNFNFASLHYEVEPLAIFITSLVENIYIRVKPGNPRQILSSLEQDWQEVVPELPFQYTFMDENLNRLYAADRQFSRLIFAFSLLAIFVACLGLYGLVTFITRQRTREIGIRKVLGASVPGIAGLISRDFLLLVLVGNIIAWPLAYYFMNRWLQEFAYRIEIGWEVFILSGGLVLVTALLTVSTQAIRTALANPVEVLRYE